jgi:hypothetical protein
MRVNPFLSLSAEPRSFIWTLDRGAARYGDVPGAGSGFKATLTIRAMDGMQYPIGNAERRQKIVENLSALVMEFDAAWSPKSSGPPGRRLEWQQPET